MATSEIEQLKALTDGGNGLTDLQLLDVINREGSVDAAARYIWRVKAAGYASMVDISESGSSRSMGDLYKNALAMGDSLKPATSETVVKTSRRAVRR